MNLPVDVSTAITALAAAAVAYVCVQYWEEIKGVWAELCEIVGELVGDIWNEVEEQIAKAQRADANKKTRTDAYEIAYQVNQEDGNLVPIVCKIKYKHGRRKTKKSFIFVANVDAYQKPGKKKPKVQLEIILERADKKGGVYTVVKREYVPTVSYLKNYELVYGAKTGHYKLRCNIKPVIINDKIINTSLNSRYWCINRTGHIWKWNYRDNDAPNNSAVVKIIAEPDADYPNKKNSDRPSNLISDYKKEYYKVYNKKLNWSANTYDVHHIQPLFCDGVNDFYNLIHLPKKHHGHISDWFGGYF